MVYSKAMRALNRYFVRIFLPVILLVVSIVSSGCGVKGDPLPPVEPAHIGRGEPTFNRATREIVDPTLPAIDLVDPTEEEDEDE